MNIVKDENGVITIDEAWRIEAGPLRRRATATAELLDDKVTAQHYQVGRRDALGKPIQLGEPMDYIDHRSAERVFYLYRLTPVAKGSVDPVTRKKSAVDHARFMPVGEAPDEMSAISRVSELMAAEKGA